MSYVYIRSEPGLFTVGFYTPRGDWIADSDHDSRESAAKRVCYLNGGVEPYPQSENRESIAVRFYNNTGKDLE